MIPTYVADFMEIPAGIFTPYLDSNTDRRQNKRWWTVGWWVKCEKGKARQSWQGYRMFWWKGRILWRQSEEAYIHWRRDDEANGSLILVALSLFMVWGGIAEIPGPKEGHSGPRIFSAREWRMRESWLYAPYILIILASSVLIWRSQWGYDAQVINFFDKSGQSSIFDHAQQLLQDISIERTTPEEVCVDLCRRHEMSSADQCRKNGRLCLSHTVWEGL